MGKKRSAAPAQAGKGVTLERASRLYRLLHFLAAGSKTRSMVLKRLRIDIRTFYRDLELLRECGIKVGLKSRRYSLEEKTPQAVLRLPFPDPSLTLGEAKALAKGRTKVHAKLRKLLTQIMKK